MPEPTLTATIVIFAGEEIVNRETRYLAMPHFLRTVKVAHREVMAKYAPDLPTYTWVIADDGEQHFLHISTGPFRTVVWFDLSPDELARRYCELGL